MKNIYVQVTDQDLRCIDINELVKQGLLFRLVSEETPLKNIKSIIRYVERIDDCASPAYHSCIHELWQEILCSPQITPKLFITKGKNKGNPNYYFITAIVGIMLENRVYNADLYSLLSLSKKLDQTSKKPSYYKASQQYITHDLILVIRAIVKRI
jgi:hypothetical protein